MNTTLPATNPFATRRVRPGALPYLPHEGCSTRGTWRRLVDNDWRGQIVGPHGSGKSTLLAALARRCERAGRPWHQVTLTSDSRASILSLLKLASELPGGTVLVIDGIEQLPLLARLAVARARRGALLATTHRAVTPRLARLPIIATTRTSVELAERIVARLLGNASHVPPLCNSYNRHGGNLREMLFDLYDRYNR